MRLNSVPIRRCALGLACAGWLGATVYGQKPTPVAPSIIRDNPAIAYSTSPTSNPVSRLNDKLKSGEVVLESEEQLARRVHFIHENLGTAAIVEQFIDGRELYVGVIGNERLDAFPVWEMSFEKMPDNRWRIATERVKWSTQYQKRHGIMTDKASLDHETANRIRNMAKRAYRALDLNGYARIDFRLDDDGRPYVLEANPNPNLAYGEDFAESAEVSGLAYEKLLDRILTLGLRWEPERTG